MDAKERERVRQERERIAKNRVMESKLVDPMVKVLFQNMEDPPSPSRPSPPLSFSFGQYIYKESRHEDEPDTALRDGHTYMLPMSVVKHLNSLKVPVYGHVVDPNTRALRTVITGHQRRFACVPAEMTDYQPEPETDEDPLE